MGGDSAAIFCHFWSHSGGAIFEIIFLCLKVVALGDPVELLTPLILFIITLILFKPPYIPLLVTLWLLAWLLDYQHLLHAHIPHLLDSHR